MANTAEAKQADAGIVSLLILNTPHDLIIPECYKSSVGLLCNYGTLVLFVGYSFLHYRSENTKSTSK